MNKKVYKGFGKTPQEAFESLWDVMKFTDDCCLRQEDGGWCIKIVVTPPTDDERKEFEEKAYYDYTFIKLLESEDIDQCPLNQ